MKKSILAQSILLAAAGLGLPAVADIIHEEVVVTATRTPVALVDSLASVTAISREQLDIFRPLELTDVLRQVPSLEVSRSGGPGSTTSLFTRGTSGDHTLVLVDGQRLSSATSGGTSIQFLNPDQIERVEVVRGAYSSLYGSEAIGGVVQIFTRDGSASTGSYVNATAGSHDLRKTAVGTSGNSGNLRYGVHASYLDTDGINNREADPARDKDGFRNKSVNASVGYRFANDADLALRFLESNNRNEYDSTTPGERPYSDSWLQNINLKGSLPIADFWLSQLSLGVSTDDSDNYDGTTGLHTGHFRTEREQLFWQNDFTIAEDHTVTVGYDYYEDKVKSSNTYVNNAGKAVGKRDNSAVFAQYQGNWSFVDLVLGAREEDNEDFGSHTTSNVSLGFRLDDSHRLVVTWAEGFKAPTFNDLYWPASAWSAGNPDLKPEESENIEVSLRGHYDLWHWSIGYFENKVENLIAWASGPDLVLRPYNVSEAKIEGAELALGAALAGWNLSASYTYLEPKDAGNGNLLPRRSRNNLTLNADKRFGDQLTAGLSVKSQGNRYDNAANTQSLSGYTTVALRLGYQITQALEANLKLDNLFDRDYQLNRGYNQEGRTWQLGMTYRL
ncbi:MAG: TonB-dependent receptor [Porticoccaceae bacterium]